MTDETNEIQKKDGWTLVAKRGRDFLWDIGEGMAIVTSQSRIVSEIPVPLSSALARGYWEMVDESSSQI
mgnify:CR=1 FL=1